MDKTNLSGKRYLFALSIINDALDDWTEERRTAMIIDITEIKERMLSGEDAKSESLLSGGDASACSKKKIIIFFYQ